MTGQKKGSYNPKRRNANLRRSEVTKKRSCIEGKLRCEEAKLGFEEAKQLPIVSLLLRTVTLHEQGKQNGEENSRSPSPASSKEKSTKRQSSSWCCTKSVIFVLFGVCITMAAVIHENKEFQVQIDTFLRQHIDGETLDSIYFNVNKYADIVITKGKETVQTLKTLMKEYLDKDGDQTEQRKNEEEEKTRKAREDNERAAKLKAQEEEQKRKAEEQERQKREAKRKMEEENKRKEEQMKAEKEKKRKEEEAKQKAEEERRKAEEEQKRKEREAKQRAEEEKRKAEEEKKRKEEEAKQRAEEERKRQEEKKKAEEEKKRKEEEAKRKAEDERKRQEERKKAEEEKKRKEEEARQKAEEERKRQEEKKKAEEEKKRKEEEAKQKAEEERKRKEEIRKTEEEKRKKEEEAKQKAEEEQKRKEELRKAEDEKKKEEAKQKEEDIKKKEMLKKAEEEKKKKEEEAKQKAEEERKRKEELRKEEEEKKKREAEQKAEEERKIKEKLRKAEEEKKKKEEEAKQKAEEERKRQEEKKKDEEEKKKKEEAKLKAEEERRKQEDLQKVEEEKKKEAAKQKAEEEKKKSEEKPSSKDSITNTFDYPLRNLLDKADDLLEKEELSAALDQYDSILSKHPSSPRALHGKALVLDRQAEQQQSNTLLEQSIATMEKVLDGKDVPDDLLIMAGKKLAQRQSFRGWNGKAIKTWKFLTEKFPTHLDLKNQLGVSYLVIGKNDEAKEIFKQVLTTDSSNGFAKVHIGFIIKTHDNDASKAIPFLREGVDSGAEGTNDGRFYFHLGDAYQRTNQTSLAHKVYEDGAQKGLFLSKFQRSLYNIDSLTGRPWWTAEQTGYQKYLQILEDNWQLIRDEGMKQLDTKTGSFVPEEENLREKGDWKQFTLYARGKKVEKNCARVPKVCDLIDKIPDAKGCTRGQVKYSVMHPGVHVWPHCGPTNCRIRAHLGLKVPPGPKIRVAEETRQWKEGKIIIFDDSFEHEVWHDGKELRMVLIVDFWHPELTQRQKQTLSPI